MLLKLCAWIAFAFTLPACAEEVSLEVVKGSEVPVKPAVAGMGIQFVYQDQLLTPAERQDILKLKIPVQRIPAGTQSMFFDWETGHFQGKGIKAERPLAQVPLQDYFDLAHQLGADVTYVVNVYQDSPEKTRRLAELAKEKGYPIRYWELGNETAADLYQDKFHDVSDYLAAARAHEAAIRAVFPDAQTALSTMNRDFQSSGWNRALATQKDFKNIVVHRYVSPAADKSKRQAMAKTGEQFDAGGQLKRLLNYSDPDRLNYADLFPGKRFWVTEWGMLYTQMDIQNSMAHALWTGRTFMQYLRHPEVDMACYFILNAPPFELIADQGGKVVHRVPYYVYQFMTELVANYKTTAPVRIGKSGADDVAGQYFGAADDRSAFLLVNASGHASDVRVSDRDRDLVVDTLGADQPSASNGHSMATTQALRTQATESVTPKHAEQHGSKVSLPPYGVVLVQMH